MKATLTSLTLAALALGGTTAIAAPKQDVGAVVDPFRPTGRLNVSKNVVRTGTHASLDWEITYPVALEDVVDINPDDSITPKKRTLMEVRIAGAAFQVGSTHTPLALQSKIGGSGWGTLFQGNDASVQPNQIVLSKVVEAGERIDFAARASNGSGGWYSSRDTLTTSNTLIALTNGAEVPHYTPVANQGTISSFLSSYITADPAKPGKFKTLLGPREVIYLFELYATDPNSSSYDAQDVVVVVSFKDVE